MFIERFSGTCGKRVSYLIVSEDEAAVVDPDGSVPERYVRAARRHGASLVAILDTRLEIGDAAPHRELVRRTGAMLYVWDEIETDVPHQGVDGDEMILIGSSLVVAMETPELLPETMSWYVDGEDQRALFAGDASVEALAQVVPYLPGDTLILPAGGPIPVPRAKP